MCLAASQGIFEDFRRMGVNVLIPEYPGYGMSAGTPSEQGCYDAATAAYTYLLQRADIDRSRIVVAGLSIGCGPAIDLCTRVRVAGLVLVVPLTNIREIGADIAPWYFRWAIPMVAHYVAFDNRAKISRVDAPILLVGATLDQVTSSRRTDELVAAAKSGVDRVTVEADHDGSWAAGKGDIEKWLNRLVAAHL